MCVVSDCVTPETGTSWLSFSFSTTDLLDLDELLICPQRSDHSHYNLLVCPQRSDHSHYNLLLCPQRSDHSHYNLLLCPQRSDHSHYNLLVCPQRSDHSHYNLLVWHLTLKYHLHNLLETSNWPEGDVPPSLPGLELGDMFFWPMEQLTMLTLVTSLPTAIVN